MRTFSDVLGRSEERQNLKSGGVVISLLCAIIVVVFLALNFDIGIAPDASVPATQTDALTD